MNNIKMMLNVYNNTFSDKFKSLTAPLETCFGIDECIYTYISNEGDFFAISNQSDPAVYYFSEEFYKSSLLVRHPDNYINGALLPAAIPNEHIEPLMKDKFGYAAETLLAIFRRDSNGVHKFLFNRRHAESSIISHYMIKLPLLEYFCTHLINELEPYKIVMEKHTINVGQSIGDEFFKVAMPEQQLKEVSTRKKFLEELGILPKNFKVHTAFSPQEKKCLAMINTGKTIKETAKILNLSSRTVEFYLENVKNKMGCYSKPELIEMLQIYKLLGIL